MKDGGADHIKSHQLDLDPGLLQNVSAGTRYRLLGNQSADTTADEGQAFHLPFDREQYTIDRMAHAAARAVVLVAGKVLPLHPKRPRHRSRGKVMEGCAECASGPLADLPALGEWDGYQDTTVDGMETDMATEEWEKGVRLTEQRSDSPTPEPATQPTATATHPHTPSQPPAPTSTQPGLARQDCEDNRRYPDQRQQRTDMQADQPTQPNHPTASQPSAGTGTRHVTGDSAEDSTRRRPFRIPSRSQPAVGEHPHGQASLLA